MHITVYVDDLLIVGPSGADIKKINILSRIFTFNLSALVYI
jgi:hypothetical protein